jgi:SGNH domain (fused to AT3 domains)
VHNSQNGSRTGGRPSKLGRYSRQAAVALVAALSPLAIFGHPPAEAANKPFTSPAQLQILVNQAVSISQLPSSTSPPIADVQTSDWGQPMAVAAGCSGAIIAETTLPVGKCTFGDTKGKHTIVIFGDSHATMWLPAFNAIGQKLHLRVIDLWKSNCAAVVGSFTPWINYEDVQYPQCTKFKRWAIKEINSLDPSIVVLSDQDGDGDKPGEKTISPAAWQAGIAKTLDLITSPGTKKVVLGDVPYLYNDSGGATDCLAAHESNVQGCSEPVSEATYSPYNGADKEGAAIGGAQYIDVAPWMCSNTCTAIVGHDLVYVDTGHLTGPMTLLMSGALETSLSIDVIGATAH